MLRVTFNFFVRTPTMALICGGILLLLFSTVFEELKIWGVLLILLGFLLYILPEVLKLESATLIVPRR